MSRWFALLLGIILLCGLLASHATPAANTARVKLVPPQTLSVMAGERVTFTAVLLAQGQFSGPTYFDLPELNGAIIMQDAERPILGSQQVGDETYVSASYDFAVYPQRAGRLRVGSITVRFSSKQGYDQPIMAHRLQTESFDMEVTAPPGAVPGEVIVSTSTLEATETWSPTSASAKVGDAFTRGITVRAEDLPAMLLPPPNFQQVEGFALYKKAPQIQDKAERGTLIAERTDSVTYVSERPGVFQIPELSLRWWDPDKAVWQTKRFPAVTLEVAKNPMLASQPADSDGFIKSPSTADLFLWGSVGLAALVFVLLFPGQYLKQRWQVWRIRYAASEPAQWKRLRHACGRNNATEVYAELSRWLAYFGLSTPCLTVDSIDGVSDRLREACVNLQQQLAGIESSWEARVLIEELAALRRQLQLSGHAASDSPLPPLNPTRPALSRIS